tara:strand:+ start:235687 stop:235803 length:117 start_codon:yes stop_codon:yes gene_type:complete
MAVKPMSRKALLASPAQYSNKKLNRTNARPLLNRDAAQ